MLKLIFEPPDPQSSSISDATHTTSIYPTKLTAFTDVRLGRLCTDPMWWKRGIKIWFSFGRFVCRQAEEERDGMEKVKLDNRRILFNLLPAHVAQHFLMSNPRNMVSHANRQAVRQADQQVDKKVENKTSEGVIAGHFLIMLSVFILRTCTISPTRKSVSCLLRFRTLMISTSSWTVTTWEWSAWDC